MRRPTRFGFDSWATGIGLETPDTTARARTAFGFDNHVSDVSGIAEATAKQAAVADDASAHARSDHDTHHVHLAATCPAPCFAKRERLGVVVDKGG